MRVSVEFPSVMYREGPAGILRLGREIEEAGYDQLDLFDHVVMGHPTKSREPARYSAKMPLLEALETLGFLAAATRTIGLGTEVLVLPQRHPVLVAKQVSTLDTLSGGRMRLGVGVGWQESEYQALGEDFKNRGRRMDDAIRLLRVCWSEDPIDFDSDFYPMDAMAMEPKPPQGGSLPIWVGGHSDAALRRAGRLGDGWLAVGYDDLFAAGADKIAQVRKYAEEADRDPQQLGFHAQLSPPPRPGNDADRTFYAEPDRVAESAAKLQDLGFDGVAVNLTGVFLAGARTVDAMVDVSHSILESIRRRT